MSEALNLKPCPFCGSEATLDITEPHGHIFANVIDTTGSAIITCNGCSAWMIYDTAEIATYAWNRRAGEQHE